MIDMQMLEGKATICTDLIKHWKKYDLTDTKKEMEDFVTVMIIRKIDIKKFLDKNYKTGDRIDDLYITVKKPDKKSIIKEILKYNLVFKSHYDIGFYAMMHDDQFIERDIYEGSMQSPWGIVIVPDI